LVVGNQGEGQSTQDVLGYGIGPKAQQYSPMNTLDAGIVALNKDTGHTDRNGYFYVVDRANGDFKKAFPFVDNIT
jgi:glucose dehydrogenase